MNEFKRQLVNIEAHLRHLLPATLYAEVWLDPSRENLDRVFDHLQTLYRSILYNYLPRPLMESLPELGQTRHEKPQGALMFTDLVGFTSLVEKNGRDGKEGAEKILKLLNKYFQKMLEIVSKSGGDLLEFTGDALLIQFSSNQSQKDIIHAIRAGLRMQRAVGEIFEEETNSEKNVIRMRIGLHFGEFLVADIGTPHRMEHILLGKSVTDAKLAEGMGTPGFVCITDAMRLRAGDKFRYILNRSSDDYWLVDDDLNDKLGDHEWITKSRSASVQSWDKSRKGLIDDITDAINKIEPLVGFIPRPILNLLVENAKKREIPADFAQATIMFINLLGLPKDLEKIEEDRLKKAVSVFSRAISLINAEIESRGGVMKKVTFHLNAPDVMVIFGVPNAHTNDSERAVQTAIRIQERMIELNNDFNGSQDKIHLHCHIGIAQGQVFAAELGDSRGRREFNVLGNAVNTAARLMKFAVDISKEEETQIPILMTETVFDSIKHIDTYEDNESKKDYSLEKYSDVQLKGRSSPQTLYKLLPNNGGNQNET